MRINKEQRERRIRQDAYKIVWAPVIITRRFLKAASVLVPRDVCASQEKRFLLLHILDCYMPERCGEYVLLW